MAKGDQVLDLEEILFVLQKKDPVTKEWITQDRHTHRGRTSANTALHELREDRQKYGEEWRSIQKQEAERYREGWTDCADYIEREFGIQLSKKPGDPVVVHVSRSTHRRANSRGPSSPQGE